MKKKKLKTSFQSLLEDEGDFLEDPVPEQDLKPADAEMPAAVLDEEFIKRLRDFQPGDLVEGIELLEKIELIAADPSLGKSKAGALKKIKSILEDVVKNGETDAYVKAAPLLDKLSGKKSKKTAEKKAAPKKAVKEEPAEKAVVIDLPDTISIEVDDGDIMSSFIQEAKEHLEDIEEKIIKFENEGDPDIVNTIFRSVHTIKGTSSFLDLDSIKTLSHKLEFLLDDVRKGTVKADSNVIDVLLEGTDFLGIMINELADLYFSATGSTINLPSHKGEIEKLEGKINSLGKTAEEEPPEKEEKEIKNIISEEIASAFAAESADLLDEAEQILLMLERGEADESSINTVFRNIHTIKGNAGFIGFSTAERVCMQMESTLDSIRNNEKKINPGVISILLQTIDIIKRSIESPHEVIEETEITVKALGEILLEEGKIDKEDLDKALDIQEMKVGEILLTEGKISEEDLKTAIIKQEAQKLRGTAPTVTTMERKDIRVDMGKIDKLFNLMGELITAEDIIIHNPEIEKLKHIERSINYLVKITREMQEITMSIRMIPLEGLFNRMRRLVRDLSKKVDKKVELKIFGQDTEMDKNVTDEIADPLVHIIRNSLDHGLEPKEVRLKKGKDAVGNITLGAKYEGNEIWIIIKDDGAGLNRKKILAKAISTGIVEAENAEELSDEEVWPLIFAPGFSTAEKVTEVSGRGVGMDVVRSNIEKLRGKIAIKSKKDKGTEITLKIPLTLAIMDGVTFRVGSTVFALPIGDIREFHKASSDQVTVVESGKEVLKLRENVIPIIKLAVVYNKKEGVTSINEGIFLIVEANDRRAAFLVDEIIGYHQIVVKALPDSFKGISSISGCSIMGNGEVNLIIDTGSLLNEVLI